LTVYRAHDEGAEVSQGLSAKKGRVLPNSADIKHPKSLNSNTLLIRTRF
jgi:hypothetical protein